MTTTVSCPICDRSVPAVHINNHIDSGCESHVIAASFSSGENLPDSGDKRQSQEGESGDKGLHSGKDNRNDNTKVASIFRSSQLQQRGAVTSAATAASSVVSGLGSGNWEVEERVDAEGVKDGDNGVDAEGGHDETGQLREGEEGEDRLLNDKANVNTTAPEGVEAVLPVSRAIAAEAASDGSLKTAKIGGQKRSVEDMLSSAHELVLETSSTTMGKMPSAGLGSTTQPILNERSKGLLENTPKPKRVKPTTALQRAQPLAERMRPKTLDQVQGQELVGPDGVLRNLIVTDKIPSLILWGGAGTGKTTTARLMAQQTGARFVEINSTSTGVAELKKIFAEARADLGGVAGRKTIVFCDEIHRFSRSQQDVFLGPVEAGTITLVGATTENPSFKVQAALLSRCRVFTLKKLGVLDIETILRRAVEQEGGAYGVDTTLVDGEMISYLANFADGDARTGLNLLELAMDLSSRSGLSKDDIKRSLTKTLVYDRAGDQHYDTISAFHKSVRGSDPDAALYYLARMIQSGEDALYIARRMVVIASEDIGLADNSMIGLATATYAAAEKVGMPEARINLAHCATALALAKKSTRAYRGLSNAFAALKKPGVAALPIPIHLRNAPTRLMKEMGYGKEYKYNPQYVDGQVKQTYLPDELSGAVFLEDRDLGTELDSDLSEDG